MAQTVLLDLDGTLTDPYPGISASILHALEKLGRPAVDEATLRAAVGPPLEAAFAAMLDGDAVMAKEALRLYRERYAPVGIYENRVFDGIPELLGQLRADGLRLFIASSKPRVFCEAIADHFGFASYFERIYGSELDGSRVGKADLIAHLLAEEGIEAGRSVMVGDRRHDIDGARANGMRVIGVAWGYGSAEEFAASPPDAMVASVEDLRTEILRQLAIIP
ncbi:HAD family hydrolase [Kaistia algarum]|uniref:HAD family hydrolase n=1 Tax=Kaistia algarum TaxID=2083279 RepID=UPI002257E81D|nr:HAD family hydrolase [Kaistia algarum]MCX5515265.1 HAD family hydrolase [Kaistia algarum]